MEVLEKTGSNLTLTLKTLFLHRISLPSRRPGFTTDATRLQRYLPTALHAVLRAGA